MISIHVSLQIRFRAFGVTFANVALDQKVPVPELEALAIFLGSAKQIFSYNDHGVSLILTVLKS